MPRTTVYMEDMSKEFDNHSDPITLEDLATFSEAPITFKGRRNAPFELNSLLRFFDGQEQQRDPLTNEPVEVNDLEPVLTRDNHAAYRNTLVRLAEKGWVDGRQLEADAADYERRRRKDRNAMAHSGQALTDFVLERLRPVEQATLWGRFCSRRRGNGGTDAARLALDVELCAPLMREHAESLPFCTARHHVATFLQQRLKAWSECVNHTPVWFSVNSLCNDFMALYSTVFPDAPLQIGRARIVSIMLKMATSLESCYIVNYPNDAVAIVMHMWQRHLLTYLLGDAKEEEEAFFRAPHTDEEIVVRLFQMERKRHIAGLFLLELSEDQLDDWVLSSGAFAQNDEGYFFLKPGTVIPPISTIPRNAPYETNATLTTLRRGLEQIERERQEAEEDRQRQEEAAAARHHHPPRQRSSGSSSRSDA